MPHLGERLEDTCLVEAQCMSVVKAVCFPLPSGYQDRSGAQSTGKSFKSHPDSSNVSCYSVAVLSLSWSHLCSLSFLSLSVSLPWIACFRVHQAFPSDNCYHIHKMAGGKVTRLKLSHALGTCAINDVNSLRSSLFGKWDHKVSTCQSLLTSVKALLVHKSIKATLQKRKRL